MQSIKVYITLLSFISLYTCGPSAGWPGQAAPEINRTDLKLHAELGLFLYQEKPFTGTALTHSAHNTLVVSESFENGRRHGQLKKWYSDGTLSYSASYQNGKLNGPGNSWWRSGQMRSAFNFVEGVVHGKQTQWYKSGAKFKEINLVQGKEQGLQKAWRENGKIYNNYEARNGRIFGLKRSQLCFELDEEKVQYAD